MNAQAIAKQVPVDQLPVAAPPQGNPLMEMLAEAIRAGQPIDVIREIKAMVTEIAADEARKAFDEAVSAAKAEIKPIVRTRDGHNSKYADMGDVADAIDPIISKYGLSYRHKAAQSPQISVTCILSHKAGHFEETTLTAGADKTGAKNDIQAIGSALTYLQRYTVMLALGLATTRDDDGQAGAATTSDTLSKAKARPIDKEMRDEINACQTESELKILWHSKPFQAEYVKMPKDWQQSLIEHFDDALATVRAVTSSPGYVPPQF